jgi:hypothetical protein
VPLILIDGRVIAAYSRGKIVLPKSNMLDETIHWHRGNTGGGPPLKKF